MKTLHNDATDAAVLVMRIYLDGDGWMCEDNSHETYDAFGTNTLPLPFLRGARVPQIVSTLQELNPDATIIVEDRS